MLGVDDDDDCDPAIQIEHIYSIRLAADECEYKDTKSRVGQTAPKKAASVSTFYYHPPSKRLFVGLDDGELCFWKLASDGSGSCHAVGSHKGAISSICIPASTDGDLGASGLILSGSYDATVKIWDYQGKIKLSPTISVQTLYGHGGTITCMVTNGEYLITGNYRLHCSHLEKRRRTSGTHLSMARAAGRPISMHSQNVYATDMIRWSLLIHMLGIITVYSHKSWPS
jgi:hypothetical protein